VGCPFAIGRGLLHCHVVSLITSRVSDAGGQLQQQQHTYSTKAGNDTAMRMVGSLAAAAMLLVPQTAMAAARLPPVDSGEP